MKENIARTRRNDIIFSAIEIESVFSKVIRLKKNKSILRHDETHAQKRFFFLAVNIILNYASYKFLVPTTNKKNDFRKPWREN